MSEVEIIRTDHKLFTKYTSKVNGKIFEISRKLKDGSGIIFEKKMCPDCGLKYKGAKLTIDYGTTCEFICPICSIPVN